MIVRELVTALGFELNDAPLKKYDKQIDATKGKTNGVAAAARGIGTAYKVAAGLVAVGVGWITKNIIDVTAETERYRVVLGTMMGDQEKANKIIHDLDYSPVSDFYGTANAIGGLQGMVTFGMQAEEASDALTRLADIAQGNKAAFVSMSQNMGQVFAKGKADATDLKQFVMQGFDVVGEVAKQSGKSRAEIEKAGVTYAQTAAALKALTSEGGKYYGMLQKQMNTISGIGNQFKSLFAATGEAIGNAISEPLKDILRYVLDIARSFQDNIVDKGAKAFNFLIHIIYQVLIFFEVMQMRIKRLGLSFEPLKEIFRDVFGLLGTVINAAVPFLYNVAAVIVAAFKPIQAFVSPVIEALKPIIKDVFSFAAEMIGAMVPVIQGLAPYFEKLGEAVARLLEKLRPILQNIMAAIKAAFEPIKAFAIPVIEGLRPIVITVFGMIGRLLDIIGSKTTRLGDNIRGLTPLFSALGNFIGKIIGPVLKLAVAIWGFNKALAIAKGAMAAFKTAQLGAKAVTMVFSGDLLKMRAGLMGLTGSSGFAKGLSDAFGLLTGKLDLATAAANKNKLAQMMLNAQMIKTKIASLAVAVAQKAQAIATGIASAATGVFNAVLAANPIVLIVLGVMALIAAIVLLVKNWDKVKAAFGKAGEAIKTGIGKLGGFFSGLGKKIAESKFGKKLSESFQGGFNKVKEKTRELLDDFKEKYPALYETAAAVFGKIKETVAVVFGWVKKYFSTVWQALKNSLGALFNVYKTVFIAIGNVVKTIALGIWNVIKTVFDAIKNVVVSILTVFKTIFTGIWNVIKTIFGTIFNTVLSIFDGLIGIWKGGGNIFVKIWKSVKLIFTKVWQGIFTIVKAAWDAIVAVWKSIVNVFSTILKGIKAVFISVWNAIKDTVFAIVEGIKNIWRSFAAFIESLWEGIKAIALVIWEGIKGAFFAVIDAVIAAWQSLTGFFSSLWEGIKGVAASAWEGIKAIFFGVVEGIKNVWNGLIGFFSGLWEAIKQGPAAVAEYIFNIFNNLWASIKEKFFGFIDTIKEGLGKVKGFVGGLWEGAVNFVTGGGEEKKPDAKPVNDLILTPEGQYSTHPDDFIMAMREPNTLIDALSRFLGQYQLQPAYAGGPADNSLVGSVIREKAQQNTYNNTDTRNTTQIDSKATITVNVPSGTTAEQAASIARQVKQAVDDSLASAVSGARGTIPSPEARRL